MAVVKSDEAQGFPDFRTEVVGAESVLVDVVNFNLGFKTTGGDLEQDLLVLRQLRIQKKVLNYLEGREVMQSEEGVKIVEEVEGQELSKSFRPPTGQVDGVGKGFEEVIGLVG
jgi:hypothetical protein